MKVKKIGFFVSTDLKFKMLRIETYQNGTWKTHLSTGSCNDNLIVWGDTVLDSFNNVSRDEDNTLYQINIMQICSDFYYDDFKFS